MTTIKNILSSACKKLNNTEAKQECEYLLSSICGISLTHQFTHPDQLITELQLNNFNQALKRRLAGEPLAYITGSRGFWDMELKVTQDVLIPRPDTECLIEQALLRIPEDVSWEIADLGTGSGAIALAIASERPRCHVVATDQSLLALQLAEENAKSLGIKNISFINGSWFLPLRDRKFDMLISNPPYIAEDDPHLEQGDLVHEPQLALISGENGLSDIGIIVKGGMQHLNQNAYLLLEHGCGQSEEVAELFNQHGYRQVFTIQDYGGNDRVTGGFVI